MYTDYKEQIDKIIQNTEKQENDKEKDILAAVTMYKLMIGVLNKYVEKEAQNNPDFNAALSLEWKSADRMLKFIWSKAEKLAIRQNNIASCCIPDDIVYDWINEYYFLDDKDQVLKERQEKAEAEAKKAAEKEEMEQMRKKAIESLSKKADWNEMSEQEKEKKINSKIKSLKTKAEKAKETGKTEDSTEQTSLFDLIQGAE